MNARFLPGIVCISSFLKLAALGAAYTTFLDNGPSENRVDMVFLGDGYTAAQQNTYQTHINSMMSHMFNDGEDPFPRYNNYFNAHRINLISQQSGADDPSTNTFVNTALDASYRFDGTTQRLLYISESKANAALAAGLNGAFTADMKFTAINTTQYGGGGGIYAVYAGGNSSATELALHELGHSFAGLADEYGGFTSNYTGGEPSEVNISKNASGAKWARWKGFSEPGLGTIGAYEGGGYYDRGIYRPSLNSKMRALDQPFDAISREEFILDIYRIVDPLDAWLSNDQPLQDPIKLWVDPIDPVTILHQWFVNGSLVNGATDDEFNPLAFGFGPGTYSIRSHNFDPTDWVRSHPELLNQDISWNVTYTIPEASTFLLLASAFFGAAALRRRPA